LWAPVGGVHRGCQGLEAGHRCLGHPCLEAAELRFPGRSSRAGWLGSWWRVAGFRVPGFRARGSRPPGYLVHCSRGRCWPDCCLVHCCLVHCWPGYCWPERQVPRYPLGPRQALCR
jgi:hypothetical protein